MALTKLKTFNVKENKRFLSKKRKLEALLNLFDSSESIISRTEKNGEESLSESYKVLKNELKKYIKKPEVEPCFYLSRLGSKAAVCFENGKIKDKPSVVPICVVDIYHFLLKSVIGHFSNEPLEWATLEEPQNIQKTVLLVVTGLTESFVSENMSILTNMREIFHRIVRTVSGNVSIAEELSTMQFITDFHLQSPHAYSTIFPSEKEVKISSIVPQEPLSKLHLLLSPIQLVMENYPLPQSVFKYSKSENYMYSKNEYTPVTPESPMFALDCEMCVTDKNQSDLARIAIVNENMETIYHSYVKPEAKVIDYLTRFSGITEEILENVETKLSDVQLQLQTLLPSNAILCGQSLNFDLHALKMIHPYVIDTSLIFNNSGIRSRKMSLKSLAKIHLNEDIQNRKDGHNPIEDSLATMKLVKLKLKNHIEYGDACFAPLTRNDGVEKVENAACNSSENNNKGISLQKEGFFAQIDKYSKKVCLIGDDNSLSEYWSENLTNDICKVSKSTNKKVVKAAFKHIPLYDLVISHLHCDTENKLDFVKFLDSTLRELFDSFNARTMFAVFIPGTDETQFLDITPGLFMASIKKPAV